MAVRIHRVLIRNFAPLLNAAVNYLAGCIDMPLVGVNWPLFVSVFSESSFICSSNLSSLNDLSKQEPQHPAVELLLQHPFAPNAPVWYDD